MKKVLFIFAVGILLLMPFYVNADVVQEWNKPLNLSNSISSSIIEVEDGVIVMQYEGSSSANNLLKKYDFSGKKVWEKKNVYGYNISAGDNSFYIWNDYKLYQLDNDGNVLLSINGSFYSSCKFISIKDNIVNNGSVGSCGGYSLEIYDNKGALFEKKSMDDSTFGRVVAMKEDDDGNIAIFSLKGDALYFYLVDENLQVLLTNYYDISGKSNEFPAYKGIVITDNKYILYGYNIVVYDKEKDDFDIIDNPVIDMKVIDDVIYSYEQRETRYTYVYGTAFVEYDSNLNIIQESSLPLMYSTTMFANGRASGFTYFKNRAVFVKKDDKVDLITLNSPINFSSGSSDHTPVYYDNDEEMVYSLAMYSIDDTNTGVTEDVDSTINDLVNNPETSSAGVIVFFIILVVSVIIFIVIKNNKDKIKKYE